MFNKINNNKIEKRLNFSRKENFDGIDLPNDIKEQVGIIIKSPLSEKSLEASRHIIKWATKQETNRTPDKKLFGILTNIVQNKAISVKIRNNLLALFSIYDLKGSEEKIIVLDPKAHLKHDEIDLKKILNRGR